MKNLFIGIAIGYFLFEVLKKNNQNQNNNQEGLPETTSIIRDTGVIDTIKDMGAGSAAIGNNFSKWVV